MFDVQGRAFELKEQQLYPQLQYWRTGVVGASGFDLLFYFYRLAPPSCRRQGQLEDQP